MKGKTKWCVSHNGVLVNNKNIIVMGIRNKKSIAWGIAKCAHEQGARLILTYEEDKERENSELFLILDYSGIMTQNMRVIVMCLP